MNNSILTFVAGVALGRGGNTTPTAPSRSIFDHPTTHASEINFRGHPDPKRASVRGLGPFAVRFITGGDVGIGGSVFSGGLTASEFLSAMANGDIRLLPYVDVSPFVWEFETGALSEFRSNVKGFSQWDLYSPLSVEELDEAGQLNSEHDRLLSLPRASYEGVPVPAAGRVITNVGDIGVQLDIATSDYFGGLTDEPLAERVPFTGFQIHLIDIKGRLYGLKVVS